MPKATAERVGDWGAQMTFDLVLHEAAGHREKSKPLDDGQWLNEIEPGSLLGGQGSDEGGAVASNAVHLKLAIELGNDRAPNLGEA